MKDMWKVRQSGYGLFCGKITIFIILAVFLAIIPLTTQAETVQLPRTGQTRCFNEAGMEIPCAGTGQDGDIQAGIEWPVPRFTYNGDGTVARPGTITDNLTGLTWLRDANCMITHYSDIDVDDISGDGLVTWLKADDFVNKINKGTYSLCGADKTDWRLPNAVELESLFNAGRIDQDVWLRSQGFSNVDAGSYWSSTTYYDDPDYGFYLGFVDGEIGYIPKTEVMAVWPVRGTTSGPAQLWRTGQTTAYATADDGDIQAGVPWPNPRFTNKGDGTIADNLTGLTWLSDMNCIHTHYPLFDTDVTPGDGGVSWEPALNFVSGINSGTYADCGAGYTDWRLPNRKELMSIFHHGQNTLFWLLSQGFVNSLSATTYWSSTTALGLFTRVASADIMEYYNIGNSPKAATSSPIWVWPVRTSEHVSTPSTPSGPIAGVTGVTYSFSTGGSTSNLGPGHPIQYRFDWGDGMAYSDWSSSGNATKSWTIPGTYAVAAQASCASHPGAESPWSTPIVVTITAATPDLTGEMLALTQDCKSNKKMTKCKISGTLRVRNTGNLGASSFSVKFYLSDDRILSKGDVLLKSKTVDSLEAGSSKDVKLNDNLPKDESALGKYLIAVIDEENVVPESNENNNTVVAPIL